MALPKNLEEYRDWLDAEIKSREQQLNTVHIQLEQLRTVRFCLPEAEPVVPERKPSRPKPAKEKSPNLCGKDGQEEYYGPCVLPKGHEGPHEFELWRRTPDRDFACWESYLDGGGTRLRCVAEKGHEGTHIWRPETRQEGDSPVNIPENTGPG